MADQSVGSTGDWLGAGVAAIVPCYNTGGRVRPVLESLLRVLDHVIVVDDGSTDGLENQVAGLPVRLISFAANRGKGHALIEGFRAAREIPGLVCAITLDSDGQHDPSEIPGLYRAFREREADLVIGSRVFSGGEVPWRSRFGNTLTVTVTGLLLGQRLPDTQSGFRLHSARYLEYILETIPGGRYETEMEILVRAVRDGFVVVPIPIKTIYEEGNKSSHFGVVRDSFRIYRRLIKLVFWSGKKRDRL